MTADFSGKQYTDTGTGTDSEGPLNALRRNSYSINTKICLINVNFPQYIEYDLGSPCLNLQVYNRWRWYTSNDSSEQDRDGRNPTKFSLQIFANDEWIEVDYGDLSSKSDWSSMSPYSEAYTGNIKIKG